MLCPEAKDIALYVMITKLKNSPHFFSPWSFKSPLSSGQTSNGAQLYHRKGCFWSSPSLPDCSSWDLLSLPVAFPHGQEDKFAALTCHFMHLQMTAEALEKNKKITEAAEF